MIGERDIEIVETGIRPGEKLHEILVSEEEVVPHHRAGRPLRDPVRAAGAPGRRTRRGRSTASTRRRERWWQGEDLARLLAQERFADRAVAGTPNLS